MWSFLINLESGRLSPLSPPICGVRSEDLKNGKHEVELKNSNEWNYILDIYSLYDSWVLYFDKSFYSKSDNYTRCYDIIVRDVVCWTTKLEKCLPRGLSRVRYSNCGLLEL